MFASFVTPSFARISCYHEPTDCLDRRSQSIDSGVYLISIMCNLKQTHIVGQKLLTALKTTEEEEEED